MHNKKTLIAVNTQKQNNDCHLNAIQERTHFKNKDFPHFIKYMGSKTKILDFVTSGINEVYNGGGICDLFSGSCSIAGSLGDSVKIYSNDIQAYSESIAHAYLNSWKNVENFISGQEIVSEAAKIVQVNLNELPEGLDYSDIEEINRYNLVEDANRDLLNVHFSFK